MAARRAWVQSATPGPLAKVVALRILDQIAAQSTRPSGGGRRMNFAERLRGVMRPGGSASPNLSYARGPSSAEPSDAADPAHRDEHRRNALDGEWREARGHRYLVVDRTYHAGYRLGRVAVPIAFPPDDGRWPRLGVAAERDRRSRRSRAGGCCSWISRRPDSREARARTRFWLDAGGSTARVSRPPVRAHQLCRRAALLEDVAALMRAVRRSRHLQRQDVRCAAHRHALSVSPARGSVQQACAHRPAAPGTPPLAPARGFPLRRE